MPRTETNKKSAAPGAWAEYWEKDSLWAQSEIWSENARIFIQNAAPFLKISHQDQVLDIGCGAGHVAERLAPLTASFLGVDSSPNLLALAHARCEHIPHVCFMQIPSRNADFKPFGKFSLILCVSVIQYYPDISSVLELVQSASQCAVPGARMLIADIPQPRNIFGTAADFSASLLQSIQDGYFLKYLRILLKLPFSKYQKFTQDHPVLEVPVKELQKKTERLGFKTQVIQESLSICERPSLLIQF